MQLFSVLCCLKTSQTSLSLSRQCIYNRNASPQHWDATFLSQKPCMCTSSCWHPRTLQTGSNPQVHPARAAGVDSIQLSLKSIAIEKKNKKKIHPVGDLLPDPQKWDWVICKCSAPPRTQLSDLAQVMSGLKAAAPKRSQDCHRLAVQEGLGESRYLFPSM